MSLKRRNYIALILILLAAVCWTFGQQMLDSHAEGDVTATTHPGVVETMYPTTEPTIHPSEDWTSSTNPTNTTPAETEPWETDRNENSRTERMLGMILSFAAVIAAGVAIFAFSQKNPIFGPDGISLIFALLATIYYISQSIDYILFAPTVMRCCFTKANLL